MESVTLADPDRHLSPAETSRCLGVTVKAVRLYESRGLVRPMRMSNGWRAYGPEAVVRLHQVLALKRLGLSLKRTVRLLSGDAMPLDSTLALQEQALIVERRRLENALELIAAARRRLGLGEALSIDDLATLTKETTMNGPLSDDDARALFEPLSEKHFSEAERAELKARNFGLDEQSQADTEWARLTEECKALMAKGDAESDDAMDLVRRWNAQVAKFTQGDPALAQKAAAVWKDAMADPAAAPSLPLTPEMFAFMGRAGQALRAREAARS